MGVRPEHLRIDSAGIPATVQVVEPTGSETQVLLKIGGQSVIGAFRERISAKPGKGASEEAKAAYEKLKADRAEMKKDVHQMHQDEKKMHQDAKAPHKGK